MNMEENNPNKIEEEIRQYKLYKIQIIENKIKEYDHVFNTIKENILSRYTKNLTSILLILFFWIMSGLLLLTGVSFLFPEQIAKLIMDSGSVYPADVKELIVVLPFFGYSSLLLSFLFGGMAWLLRKNMLKKNTIFKLSKLVKDVIGYMDVNLEEDKKKYEYFVDSMADVGKDHNGTAENVSP